MQLKQLVGAAALVAAPLATAMAYPKAGIHNRAPFPGQVTITYAGCNSDVFRVGASRLDKQGVLHEAISNHAPSNRGVCLITRITVALEGTKLPVTAYTSSGTSYSNFIIAPTEGDFRVYSDAELVRREEAKTREGKSPGFAITNTTGWPVAIALEQVGCLYYGTLKPGQDVQPQHRRRLVHDQGEHAARREGTAYGLGLREAGGRGRRRRARVRG